jgi:hypothetical protein
LFHANINQDIVGAQPLGTAGGVFMRIRDCGDDARNAGGENCIGTWRRLSVVIARLERNVESSSARSIARSTQSVYLRMGCTELRVPSFADNFTIANDNGADHWVRRRLSPSSFCQKERTTHVHAIIRRHALRCFRHRFTTQF